VREAPCPGSPTRPWWHCRIGCSLWPTAGTCSMAPVASRGVGFTYPRAARSQKRPTGSALPMPGQAVFSAMPCAPTPGCWPRCSGASCRAPWRGCSAMWMAWERTWACSCSWPTCWCCAMAGPWCWCCRRNTAGPQKGTGKKRSGGVIGSPCLGWPWCSGGIVWTGSWPTEMACRNGSAGASGAIRARPKPRDLSLHWQTGWPFTCLVRDSL